MNPYLVDVLDGIAASEVKAVTVPELLSIFKDTADINIRPDQPTGDMWRHQQAQMDETDLASHGFRDEADSSTGRSLKDFADETE